MPYITQSRRTKYDDLITRLSSALAAEGFKAGDMNYVISRLLVESFKKDKSYGEANKLIGVMECAKVEFYRKFVVPYEEQKEKENGPIE